MAKKNQKNKLFSTVSQTTSINTDQASQTISDISGVNEIIEPLTTDSDMTFDEQVPESELDAYRSKVILLEKKNAELIEKIAKYIQKIEELEKLNNMFDQRVKNTQSSSNLYIERLKE